MELKLLKNGRAIRMMAVFCIVLNALMPISADNHSFVNVWIGDFTYSSIDGNTCKVVGLENRKAEEVIIPEAIEYDGDVYTVVEIDGFYNDYDANVRKVVLPKSVKTINSWAFRKVGKTNLESINLDFVENIDMAAFEFCDNLSEIGSLMSLKTLETDAFRGTAITSVELPGSLKIVNSAFGNCKRLREVILHEGIEQIRAGFGGLVKKLSIPGSVLCISIGFDENDALTEFRFEDGPEKLKVEQGTFNTRIANFKSLYLGRDIIAERYVFDAFRNATVVEIGEDVTTLPTGAFAGFNKLPYIKIGKHIKTIPEGAFSGCVSLKKVDFAGDTEKIGLQSFYGSALDEIVIPGSVLEIGNMAFCNCSGAKSIDLGKGLKRIGDDAFSKCSSVEELTIPGNVETVGFGAFQYMKELKSLVIESGDTPIEFITESNSDYAYGYTKYIPLFEGSNLKTVKIDRNFTTSYSRAGIIKSCNDIETITVGDNVTELPEYGLAVGYDDMGHSENADLRTVYLGKNLRKLGYEAIHFNIRPDGVTKGAIYSYNPEPPEWIGNVTAGIVSDTYFPTSQINLYVPNNSLDKYSEAAVWEQFAPYSIFEFDSSKITEIETSDSCKPRYYNLNGIYMGDDRTSLSTGMYIEVRSGKIGKIIIN